MRSLVLRIYLTLVAVLLLFAAVGGWLVQRQFEHEREAARLALAERAAAWADFAQAALPPPDAPDAEQQAALDELAARIRVPLALEAGDGRRLATSAAFDRRTREAAERGGGPGRERGPVRLALDDGRTLLVLRGGPWRGPPRAWDHHREGPSGPAGMPPMAGVADGRPPPPDPPRPLLLRLPLGPAGGLLLLLALLFVAVAAAAWPVARRLTRRLETLQRGVEAFGDGALGRRVAVEGRDEVSALARSFNRAAERIEALVGANRRLVANVSHEIRSPLARLKMAVAMLEPPADDDAPPTTDPRRTRLLAEVHANIAELDALVDEVLLASRLQAQDGGPRDDDPVVDLAALAADEAEGARGDARRDGPAGWSLEGRLPAVGAALVRGDERLLRRAVRNLLQNARRYGGDRATLALQRVGDEWVLTVSDAGPGVPEAERERIFEPFHRVSGHAEHQGATGLGLSLVRQIAQRHGGSAACEAAPGGGSVFRLRLPAGG